MAAVVLSKLANKYQSNQIVSGGINDEDPNNIYFKVVYLIEGKYY